MKEKLKVLAYLFIVLIIMNPFIFWLVGGSFVSLYNQMFAALWLLVSLIYYYLWLKVRAIFIDIDTQAVKMYKGIR